MGSSPIQQYAGRKFLQPMISSLIQQYAEKSQKMFWIQNAYQNIRVLITASTGSVPKLSLAFDRRTAIKSSKDRVRSEK